MRHFLARGIAGVGLTLSAAVGAQAAPIKLVPNEIAAGDRYGSAVSVWGNAAVVGSPFDDENGANAGAVFLLRRDCSSWVVDRKLFHEDAGAGDLFGCAVAIRENVLVVGADGSTAGAAYVFRFDGGDWVFEQKLLPDPAASPINFGTALAVGGNVIVVGADEDDENETESGAAYVFRFDGKSWAREQKLSASDGEAFDFFGSAVAIDGDTCLIGSPFALATDAFAGAVYRFQFNGTAWVEEQKLLANDGGVGDGFGSSLTLETDTVVVGAPLDTSARTDSGSAYVFTSNGVTWAQSQKLGPQTEASFNRFGFSVAMSGEALVISAPGDLDKSPTPGTAQVFRFNGSAWAWERALVAADGATRDGFGWSIGLFGDRTVLGAPMDDDAAGSSYVDYLGPIGPGDFDLDGDADLIDFAAFASCVTGPDPDGAIPTECTVADLDDDGDVDLRDVAAFQRAFACGN